LKIFVIFELCSLLANQIVILAIPQVALFDSTYRVNMENFCLYAMVVMDENGFGQPAALALLRNETAETLLSFFTLFKSVNPRWIGIEVIFVDKDFTQMDQLQAHFASASVLICAFHVMKTLKFHIAKERVSVKEKQELLAAFQRILYARQDDVYIRMEEAFLALASPKLSFYYKACWGNTPQMWCFAFRVQLRTFGNNTTNRIERFFLTVKTAIRGSGRAIAKRFHLTECLEAVMSVLDFKANMAHFQDYNNAAKKLVLHRFPIPEIADVVGAELTDFAARIFRAQCALYVKENLSVQQGDRVWSVTNTQTARDYDVSCGPDSNRLICSCYVNCCFGLPCRHIIAVHHQNGEPLFNSVDVMPRWLR